MSSLLDNPDATGNTQEMDMSGRQGPIKRDEAHPPCGHIWAWSSLSSRGATQWEREGTGHSDLLGLTGTALTNVDLRRGAILQARQNVQSRHQENHAEHRDSGEGLLVLKALGPTEAERKYGRAMERELQTFLEDLLQT